MFFVMKFIDSKNTYINHKIMVLAALDRVVDVLTIPNDDVRFLAWNRNGTQLVAINCKNLLSIWKFCLKDHVIQLPRQIRSRYRLLQNLKNKKDNNHIHPIEIAYGDAFRQLSRFR